MKTDDTQHTIDRYLRDEMSPQEEKKFTEAVKGDPELKKEVTEALHIREALARRSERGVAEELRAVPSEERLRELTGRWKKGGNRPVRWTLKRVSVTAAAAAVVAVLLYGLSPQYSTGSLYGEYGSLPPYEPLSSRGGESYLPELLSGVDSARAYYESGEAEAALSVYRRLEEEYRAESLPDEAAFHYAVLALAAGDVGVAGTLLRQLIDSDSLFAGDAEWQLALARLRAGDRSEAIRRLDGIAVEGGFYAPKAAELSAKLKTRRLF